jgi:flagellar hook-associated protein 1
MPGSFTGIETSSRALRAFQQSLNTTGHNIANVNTKGYSRQTVDLKASESLGFLSGRQHQLGTGVQISTINRIRDTLIEGRRQQVMGDQGRFEGNLSNLEKVQQTFLDVDSKGISTSIDKFFNSWSALGSDPTNKSLRLEVQISGRDLAANVKGSYLNLQDIQRSQTKQTIDTFAEIQSLAEKVAQLNLDIRKSTASGGSPNDLMDTRDQTIADLSKLVDINTSQASDGSYNVQIGSFTLVDQVGARTMPTTYDPVLSNFTDGSSVWPITTGKLKGLFDASNKVTATMTNLDNLANTLRTEVNLRHTAGVNPAGLVAQNFFNEAPLPPQTGAIDFALDAAVDTNINAISVGTTTAASDGSVALGISGFRDIKVAALGNQTIGGFFSSVITDVGQSVRQAKSNLSTTYALSDQIDQQVQAVSGVNMDDELANMQRFQRSYQAAAKVLSVMNETLGDLINIIR